METKLFNFEVKADGDDGTIEGYGSVFGNLDRGQDIVLKGAFADSIASGRKPKMLAQHDPSQVIGVWDEVLEDDHGLRLKGRLALKTPEGARYHELLKLKAFDGLSVGYRVTDDEWEGSIRRIKSADLWEVSVVTFPMNELATVDAVKAADLTKRDFEKLLTHDAGLSRSVARALMSGGLEAVKGMQAAASDERELIELLKARSKI